MTTSTLFLNYITCVDHAFIDYRGRVIGGSYHPIFEVTGKVEEKESVLIDFSKVKKQLKEFIDHKETGFDHKLWFIPEYSEGSVIRIDENRVEIITPAVHLKMPANAVKVFNTKFDGSFIDTVEQEFDEYLTQHLKTAHADLDVSVKTKIIAQPFAQGSDYTMFRYIHGLKNSSSWGCQNHSHGHLSFAEFEWKPLKELPNKMAALDAVRVLDNTLFIFRENIVAENDDYIQIEYTTCRGTFWAQYNKGLMKCQILETETTIEHIVNWFVEKNRTLLEMTGVHRVYISEGLAKGAMVEL